MDSESARLQSALAGKYAIERELGRGATATVHLARDLKHGRSVAVKVLRPDLAATLGSERFVREIEIAASLSHPHILPLFDSGEAGGFLYYVMPYVEGETLRQRLQRDGTIPLDEAIRISRQVASALAHAHERGIVHRDVKPENILLSGDQAVVADFGIARALSAAGGDRLTGTGLAIGTPAYISPEQVFGTAELDGRTDIYSLGCVLYEMVAGRPPFEAATLQALLARHAVYAPPRLRTVQSDVPLFVERAVERALAKDPEDRFESATAFGEALTTGTVVARAGWRRRGRLLAGAVTALVVIAAGWGLATHASATRIQRIAVLPLTDLAADSAHEHLLEGVHEALIAELAQLGLSVTARSTMRRYQGTALSISEIARELDVDAVIEGSFFLRRDSLAIAARLYHGRTEKELWSGSYDSDLRNVVSLYRGFARSIADEIRLRLSTVAEERLARSTAINPAVYEAYLRGMYLLSRSTPVDDLSEALGWFEQALEANPADPLAYTGLSYAYVTLGHGPAPPPDVWPKARAAAERALRLDSTVAEAWSAVAQVKYYYEWDWDGAGHAFRRANELNPSLSENRYHHAWYLLVVGQGEAAIAEHHRARELDPLTPMHTVWLPGIHMWLRDYERAIAESRFAAEQFPDHPVPLYVRGMSAALLGRYGEAIEAHERMAEINPRWLHALGITYARAGRRDDALRILQELESQPATPWLALSLAELHTALGNRDEALDWLEFEPPHGWWNGIGVNPLLDDLRDEPRFQMLLEKLNTPRH